MYSDKALFSLISDITGLICDDHLGEDDDSFKIVLLD